jgi:hypothetical protein
LCVRRVYHHADAVCPMHSCAAHARLTLQTGASRTTEATQCAQVVRHLIHSEGNHSADYTGCQVVLLHLPGRLHLLDCAGAPDRVMPHSMTPPSNVCSEWKMQSPSLSWLHSPIASIQRTTHYAVANNGHPVSIDVAQRQESPRIPNCTYDILATILVKDRTTYGCASRRS